MWRFAGAFIAVTLLALVIVPYIVQQRVVGLRTSITASEPARTLVLRWQFDLVREMSALGDLLLTGDTSYVAAYEAALREEREIVAELRPLARTMGPDVSDPVEHAIAEAGRWHALIDSAGPRRVRSGESPAVVRRGRARFEQLLDAIAAVDSTIIDATAERRREIEEAETRGRNMTLLLAALALLAAVLGVALAERLRRYAQEAERRREEADAALAQTAQASEARARLLRGITHDVKNPLGAAKGYAELLEMGVKAPLLPEQAPLVAGVQRSVDNALAIIADLLDLARVDSGAIAISRERVDLNQIAREAVADHDAAARAAGHSICAVQHDHAVDAFTDPVRVRQVIDNLISNAIKYTPPPGQISIRARPAGESGEGGRWAAIEVADNGPGIPPESREAVFDEFTRLSESSPVKGHGLGLAIARGIARQLGGDLYIADSDVGALFVLRIPQRDEGGTGDRRKSAG